MIGIPRWFVSSNDVQPVDLRLIIVVLNLMLHPEFAINGWTAVNTKIVCC